MRRAGERSRSGKPVAVATAWLAIALGCGALFTAGCETQPPYADCDLDEEVTKTGVCSGDGAVGKGTTSCVVTKHPHCAQGVCVSHFGSAAFCSSECTDDSSCGDGFCWTFAENERYCVPNKLKN